MKKGTLLTKHVYTKKKHSLDARSAIPISLDCHSSMILDNLALPTSATGSDIRDTTILKT